MKEAVTEVTDTFTQEDSIEPSRSFWKGTNVHCSRRRFLGRGLEFHVCTINKIAHMKKSGNLLKASCIIKLSLLFCSL